MNRFFNVLTLVIFMTIISCTKEVDNQNVVKSSAIFNPDLDYGIMTDQDGNNYKTIDIGEQTWMAENLRVTTYRNGDSVNKIIDSTSWINSSKGAYCSYNNTKSKDTIVTNGLLYNWYTIIDTRNIAPIGWHIPSNAEWKELATYLGGIEISGNKLKEVGNEHWINSDIGADNSSGFTALPSGENGGFYFGMGFTSRWWTSNEYNEKIAWGISLQIDLESMIIHSTSKKCGYSIRCIKD